MKRPDGNTIRNNIVFNAAAIMTAKVKYIRLTADIFAARNTNEGDVQSALLKAQAKEIEAAVAVMDKWGGSWA